MRGAICLICLVLLAWVLAAGCSSPTEPTLLDPRIPQCVADKGDTTCVPIPAPLATCRQVVYQWENGVPVDSVVFISICPYK